MIENELLVLISDIELSSKPEKSDKKIKKTIFKSFRSKSLTLTEFADCLGRGMTFSGATYKNDNKSKLNWQSQTILSLDFDNTGDESDIAIADALKICSENDISPNIYYETFSSRVEPIYKNAVRFRFIFVLDEPIKDKDKAEEAIYILCSLFPNVSLDKCSQRLSQMMFGARSKVIIIEENKRLSMGDLERLRRKHGLVYTQALKKTENEIKYSDKSEFKESDVRIKAALPTLLSSCKVLYNFYYGIGQDINGEAKGNFKDKTCDELLCLISTNMKMFNGGMIEYNRIIKKYSQYSSDKFNKGKYLTPYNLSRSPYPEDHIYKNLFQLYQSKKGKNPPVIFEKPDIKSLDQTLDLLQSSIKQIVNGKLNSLNILKYPTGIGKTKALIEFLLELVRSNDKRKLVICFENHELKNEFKEALLVRIKDEYSDVGEIVYQSNFCTSPDRLVFDDDIINSKISSAFKSGKTSLAKRIINEEAKRGNVLATKYLDQISEYYLEKDDKHVLTTHSKGLYHDFKQDFILFDESPHKYQTQTKRILISDLKKLKNYYSKPEELNIVIDMLSNMEKNTATINIFNYSKISELERIIDENEFKSNVTDFLNFTSLVHYVDESDKNTADVYEYIQYQPFKTDKSTTILSASVDHEYYVNKNKTLLVKQNINSEIVEFTQLKGTMSQIHDKNTYSKTWWKYR